MWTLHIDIIKYISGDDMDNWLVKSMDDVDRLHVQIDNLNDSADDMDNWLSREMDDVDSLHVNIDNLNNPIVGFCFIRVTRRIPRALQRKSL